MRIVMLEISATRLLQGRRVSCVQITEARLHDVGEPHILHSLGVECGSDEVRPQKNSHQNARLHPYLAIAALVGYALFRDDRIRYDATAKTYFVPGSWIPLAVIMAIFFAKYVYAVMNALNAAVISATAFVIGLSAVYGVLSGYFAARALNLIRLAEMG